MALLMSTINLPPPREMDPGSPHNRKTAMAGGTDSARSRLFSASVQISITPLARYRCEFVVVRGLAGTSGLFLRLPWMLMMM